MASSPHPTRNLALIGIVVVTAVVVTVVLGFGSDDSSDQAVVTRPAPTTTTAPTTTEPPTTAPAPTTTIPLPPGDYTAMCVELQGLVESYGSDDTIAGFTRLFENLDFAALLAASPEGIRPYVETLQGQRQQILDALAVSQDVAGLQKTSLPLSFYDALQHLVAVGAQECGVVGG